LKDWTSVLDVAQPTISFDTSTYDTPLKLGDVDQATHYCWIYALKSLCHENIKKVFQQFQVDAGSLPHRLYTDFDSKLIAGPTEQYLLEHGCKVCASPNNWQDKNGLVECLK